MCGIFGYIGKKEKSSLEIATAMVSQQHRGHDSWGICYLQDDIIQTQKQTGAIEPSALRFFYTKFAIGHNRYQTSGRGDFNEIQPFANKTHILAHNGQITNIDKLTSGSDTSILFHELVTNGLNRNIFDQFQGSFSLVGRDGNSLFAIRDTHGFRPLFMGKKENDFIAFASEEQALMRFGADVIAEVHPGSIYRVDENLNLTIDQAHVIKPTPCYFESMYFSSVESSFSGKPIIEMREKLGIALGGQILKNMPKLDLVVPIPDTSIPAAIALAEKLNVSYREYILKNPKSLRTFITRDRREETILNKYFFMGNQLKGKSVLLVDDSIVRGSTLRRINQYLRSIGVKEIHVASTCPPIKNPCAYGIDFPSKKELIANQPDFQKLLLADSIHYLSVETLKEIYGPQHCFACLDGNYPVAIKDSFFEARIEEHR